MHGNVKRTVLTAEMEVVITPTNTEYREGATTNEKEGAVNEMKLFCPFKKHE